MICSTNLRFLHSNFFHPCSSFLIKPSCEIKYDDDRDSHHTMSSPSNYNTISNANMSKEKFNTWSSGDGTISSIENNKTRDKVQNTFIDPMQALVDSVKEGFDLSELCYD
uniref:Ovule protein n=1 Tax=Parastrongyloides trichosuri TaxID=131310 RepID=A0A0N4ZWX4_PARTI